MQIAFRPRFPVDAVPLLDESRSAANLARQREQIAFWEGVFGPCKADPAVDFEDFHENAARLVAAARSGAPVYVFDRDGGDCVTHGLNTEANFDPARSVIALGSFKRTDALLSMPGLVAPTEDSVLGAYRYHELSAFRDLCGRPMAIAGFPDGGGHWTDERSIYRALEEMNAKGHQRFFLKLTLPKGGIYRLELPEAAPREAIHEAVLDSIGYDLARFEGARDICLVQSYLPMTHEYRFFVVDGQLVAGAGCVEVLTPLDATDRFSPIMERRRNQDTPKAEPEILNGHIAEASRFVAMAVAEKPDLRHYALDMALNPNGNSVVLELNPMLNVGLYATAYEHVLAAILAGEAQASAA